MKKQKVFIAAVVFIFAYFSSVCAEKKEAPLDSFIRKARIAQTDIEKSAADLVKLKKEYTKTGAKIDGLKASKDPGGLSGFINSFTLKYYLNRGSKIGYKIYKIERGIAALKEDYFTYVSLISEEYGNLIKDCWEKKCNEFANLCDERGEWDKAADKYSDVFSIDLSSMKLIKDYSEAAAEDIKTYLRKKIIQAEQRIFMLEEEQSIIDIMKKAGRTDAASEKKRNAEKTAELKNLKKVLQQELKKIR